MTGCHLATFFIKVASDKASYTCENMLYTIILYVIQGVIDKVTSWPYIADIKTLVAPTCCF